MKELLSHSTFTTERTASATPGAQLTRAPETRSEISTVSYRWFGGQRLMTLPLSVMVGLSVSFTVTLKEQLGPAELVQVTAVIPTAKKEPEGWSQVTVPQPAPEGSV